MQLNSNCIDSDVVIDQVLRQLQVWPILELETVYLKDRRSFLMDFMKHHLA